jgi:hypothetical protein
MVATGLGYPIVLWVFEFNQHGESPTANLDRTVVADALRVDHPRPRGQNAELRGRYRGPSSSH